MPAWTEPRTAPPTLLPAIAGGFVLARALPVVLINIREFRAEEATV